ncbi:NADH:flavin oxidoreductase/NADH oxidase family protein [soil metagenome]
MTSILSKPLVLPCGAVIPNRLGKAAMSEGLASSTNQVTPRLIAFYNRLAQSGAGLLLSGNMQVDRRHLERPNNVVLDEQTDVVTLAELAHAGKSGGASFWAQLAHTGRQVSDAINAAPLAPSAVEIQVMRGLGSFALPVPMTEEQILHAVEQFATAGVMVKKAGFDGLSLHAAHGYLFSQFLSPLSNLRTDRWGGSLENRSRFLVQTISRLREAVGPAFPIGIKLNSSDFQRGGFTHAECLVLVEMLNETSLDLLELSGGSLEQPKVMGFSVKEEGEDGPKSATTIREAYFIDFARDVHAVAKMPVMVTGGVRSAPFMIDAIEAGELDMVGLGRPILSDPDGPAKLLAGTIERLSTPELEVPHLLPWHNMQIERIGDGLEPDLQMAGAEAAERFALLEAVNLKNFLESGDHAAA